MVEFKYRPGDACLEGACKVAMKKLVRITTVPVSLRILLKGQLRFMAPYYEVTAVSSGGAELDKLVEEQGVGVYAVDMTRKITPVSDLKALFRMIRFFRKTRPMIVHTHTPKAGLLGMLAAWICRVPIRIHTVAGLPLLEAQGIKRKVLNTVEYLTYFCAHKVYPNSFRLKEIIEEEKLCRSSKLKVLGNGSSNGIDVTVFSPGQISEAASASLRESLKIAGDDLVFCFVGRVVSHKGINELMEAFTEVHEQCPHARLLLVGPFEKELDPLSEAAEKTLHTHPAVRWVGYQPDVRPYLAISDIFVFPSYREGFPNVVMQAGAMGLPSIVSDINGCNEIIREGDNGIIVPPKSSKALREAMLELANNTTKRAALAAQSREAIVSRYRQEMIWNTLLEEYRTLEKELIV